MPPVEMPAVLLDSEADRVTIEKLKGQLSLALTVLRSLGFDASDFLL